MCPDRQRRGAGWGQAVRRRPGERQDPYRVIYEMGRLAVALLFAQLPLGVMGPGFRQDDIESVARLCPYRRYPFARE